MKETSYSYRELNETIKHLESELSKRKLYLNNRTITESKEPNIEEKIVNDKKYSDKIIELMNNCLFKCKYLSDSEQEAVVKELLELNSKYMKYNEKKIEEKYSSSISLYNENSKIEELKSDIIDIDLKIDKLLQIKKEKELINQEAKSFENYLKSSISEGNQSLALRKNSF